MIPRAINALSVIQSRYIIGILDDFSLGLVYINLNVMLV